MVTVDERREDLAFLRDVQMQEWGVGEQGGEIHFIGSQSKRELRKI